MEENVESSENHEEALQQLRRWQDEQRARLIEQQKQQRELLLEKQKKLLSMLNSTSSDPAPGCEDSQSVSGALRKDTLETEFVPNQQQLHSPKTIDDVPLKKPQALQSFQQIMETSLNSKVPTTKSSPEPPERKFTFLKRGEGLKKRFGKASNPVLKKEKAKVNQAVAKQCLGKENKQPLKSESIPVSRVQDNHNSAPLQPQLSLANQRNSRITIEKPCEQIPNPSLLKGFSSQVVVEERERCTNEARPSSLFEEHIGAFHNQNSLKDNCDSAKDVGVSHNEEELAVFELLERFATINASFSSSSSLIGQLIEKGVNHLPSPSKVINFLSKRRLDSPEDSSGRQEPTAAAKSQKKVHFAEVLEQQQNEDSGEAWLDDITTENAVADLSPYVSNTLQRGPYADEPSPILTGEHKPNLDETPTSPIGFPDYKKLFGNPVRTLWASEDFSPIQSENTAKEPRNVETHELESEVLKDSGIPIPLPVDDPRLVYQGSLLRSRLSSLEREIANYRRESESLRRARKEHEELKIKLEQEQEKFKRYTENEKRRLQLLHSEEQKRVRSEQIKNLPQLKENEEQITKLRDELKQVKDEHRQKENKWMASQTRFQEKVRTLEIRNRELTEALEKLRSEEQTLRRKLNASLRPGALVSKGPKVGNVSEDKFESPLRPGTPTLSKPANTDAIPSENSSPAVNSLLNASGEGAQQGEGRSNENTLNQGAVSTAILPDGTRIMVYPNGNRKEVWPNGKGSQVIYYNGDIKQKLADGSIVYTYADSKTKHTTKPDGTDILEFANGQIETTYPDGRSQVQYPGGALKTKYPDGREEAQWPDGTKLWTDGKGHGVMTFPSGMKEIYTPICKRREYPDGTVKTVYDDGRSETRYGNGRIRVKDSAGNIITDTGAT